MYELIQVGANSFYVQSPAKIGIYKINNEEVCLIDSGSDKDAGRKVRQILDANSWRLVAIYNTHSNADHTGGNRYLQNNTGCKIYAPGIECDFVNHPLLEPSFLYGGYPSKDIRHKFLMAQDSKAEPLTDGILLNGLESIELPGHFFDMVGFRTLDDVVYLADSLCSDQTLEKYQITFVYDVAAYINTLEKIKTMQAKVFVPAHAPETENITPLAQRNIDKVLEIGEKLTEMCSEPVQFETVLQRLFVDYGLKMNFDQYILVGSTVRSYLSWLKDMGKLEVIFENNMMLWRNV